MSKYRVDGVVLDTGAARKSWAEARRWDGKNDVSVNTGTWPEYERLYLCSTGRYYIVRGNQCLPSQRWARIIDAREATAWMELNGCDIPADLQAAAAKLEEAP